MNMIGTVIKINTELYAFTAYDEYVIYHKNINLVFRFVKSVLFVYHFIKNSIAYQSQYYASAIIILILTNYLNWELYSNIQNYIFGIIWSYVRLTTYTQMQRNLNILIKIS